VPTQPGPVLRPACTAGNGTVELLEAAELPIQNGRVGHVAVGVAQSRDRGREPGQVAESSVEAHHTPRSARARRPGDRCGGVAHREGRLPAPAALRDGDLLDGGPARFDEAVEPAGGLDGVDPTELPTATADVSIGARLGQHQAHRVAGGAEPRELVVELDEGDRGGRTPPDSGRGNPTGRPLRSPRRESESSSVPPRRRPYPNATRASRPRPTTGPPRLWIRSMACPTSRPTRTGPASVQLYRPLAHARSVSGEVLRDPGDGPVVGDAGGSGVAAQQAFLSQGGIEGEHHAAGAEALVVCRRHLFSVVSGCDVPANHRPPCWRTHSGLCGGHTGCPARVWADPCPECPEPPVLSGWGPSGVRPGRRRRRRPAWSPGPWHPRRRCGRAAR